MLALRREATEIGHEARPASCCALPAPCSPRWPRVTRHASRTRAVLSSLSCRTVSPQGCQV
jgi:hypothetical protein